MLWLLILRGVAIGFRSHQDNPLWREFWDTTFSLASALLAVVLGAALGNVVRGVPLDATGFFFLPLFTNFRPGEHPGVLDWYTVLVGCLALCVLAGHGAFYLVWKTTGPVQERSRTWARKAWLTAVPLWVLATLATAWIQPEVLENLVARPWSLVFVALMVGGFIGGIPFPGPGAGARGLPVVVRAAPGPLRRRDGGQLSLLAAVHHRSGPRPHGREYGGGGLWIARGTLLVDHRHYAGRGVFRVRVPLVPGQGRVPWPRDMVTEADARS